MKGVPRPCGGDAWVIEKRPLQEERKSFGFRLVKKRCSELGRENRVFPCLRFSMLGGPEDGRVGEGSWGAGNPADTLHRLLGCHMQDPRLPWRHHVPRKGAGALAGVELGL